MPDTIALPKALQARLRRTAARTHASPESLARRVIAAHLDYLDRREQAIRAGFLSGKTEGWCSTEEVFDTVSAQRAKRSGKKQLLSSPRAGWEESFREKRPRKPENLWANLPLHEGWDK